VEHFIAPKVLSLARDVVLDDREAFDALANFASEEVKHMNLFREVRAASTNGWASRSHCCPGPATSPGRCSASTRGGAAAHGRHRVVRAAHYLTCFKDDDTLDPLSTHIFKSHWLEESQHARMDHLETLRAFKGMSDAEKDTAIDDLIELVGAVDGLLHTQAGFDVDNLERYLKRSSSRPSERRSTRTSCAPSATPSSRAGSPTRTSRSCSAR